MHYDPVRNEYTALVDRGPGGGVIPYETRLEVFGLESRVLPDPVSGTPLIIPIGRHHAAPKAATTTLELVS